MVGMPEPEFWEEAARQKEFLSVLGHKLRTPLTAIQSFSEIMLRYEVEDIDKARRFLTIIHSEAERLAREIDSLLEVSSHAGSQAEPATVSASITCE